MCSRFAFQRLNGDGRLFYHTLANIDNECGEKKKQGNRQQAGPVAHKHENGIGCQWFTPADG
jgi:hypothetical protein